MAYDACQSKSLEYKHIANVVQEDDTLDFLREIMPRKITVRQFKELMAKKAAKGDGDSESETESSSEESEEEEEEESEVVEDEEEASDKKWETEDWWKDIRSRFEFT